MRQFPRLIAVGLAWVWLYIPAYGDSIDLPDLGDNALTFISPSEEKKLGKEFMLEVRRSLPIIDDPEITHYIQKLGHQLASSSTQHPGDFTFFIVDNPTVNAFAGPGGYIGLHTGLIFSAQSESELAAVIAHEIAHVTQRHIARAYKQINDLQLPVTAAIIAAIILGGQNPELGNAALITTIAGATQSRINFTRENEQDADRVGMQLLSHSGYPTDSMSRFFKRLQQANRFNESNLPELLLTHPVTLDRITSAQDRALLYPKNTPKKETIDFQLMREKLKILTSNNQAQNIQQHQQQLKNGRYLSKESVQYGLALAYANAGSLKKALPLLESLNKTQPQQSQYVIALAKHAITSENPDKALSLLLPFSRLYPSNTPINLLLATTYLELKQPQKARGLLFASANQRPSKSTHYYNLLSKIANQLGDQAQSHHYLAEGNLLTGNSQRAIEHLEIALKLTDEKKPNKIRRIKKRLDELKKSSN